MSSNFIDNLFANAQRHFDIEPQEREGQPDKLPKNKRTKPRMKKLVKSDSKPRDSKTIKEVSEATDNAITCEDNLSDLNRHSVRPAALRLYDEILQWIRLRDNCIEKVNALVCAIMSIDSITRSEFCATQFIVLLQTLRKISLSLLEQFSLFEEKWKPEGRMIALWNQLSFYVVNMIDSLSFLDMQPFRGWVGVNLSRNPFILMTSIDGANTAITGMQMHTDLVDPETMDRCRLMSIIVFRISRGGPLPPRLLRRRLSTIYVENSESSDDDCTEYIINARRRVKSLVVRSWWKYWCTSRVLEAKRLEILATRNYMNMRVVIERLQHNVWCCVKYRTMQQRALHRKVISILEAWKDYTRWCHRLSSCRRRSLQLHCRYYLSSWRRTTREEHSVRRYWRNFKNHRLAWLFRALRNNMIMNKYILKCRLKTGTSASFKQRSAQEFCFGRWKTRCSIVLALDRLEFKAEMADLKSAFCCWKFATSDPIVPVTEQIIDLSMAVGTAAKNAALSALSEARASRKEGFTRARTVANVLLGRGAAQAYIEQAKDIDERVHRVAASAYQTSSSALRLSLEKAASMQEKVSQLGKLVNNHSPFQSIKLSTILESWQSPTEEDPILALLRQRKLVAEQEKARRSRMLQALTFARSQIQSQHSADSNRDPSWRENEDDVDSGM